MNDLMTTLAIWRPSQQWTILFQHKPYGATLWALLFDSHETLMASNYFGEAWHNSPKKSESDYVIGYQTTAGKARDRLVKRLGPVRGFTEPWRAFSLTRALALSLAAIPASWPLCFDASAVTIETNETIIRSTHYVELMAVAIKAAEELGQHPPSRDIDATRLLLAMTHGMNPETPLVAPSNELDSSLPWPTSGSAVEYELLGQPVECPSSYVETMTRARHQWQARW